MSYPAASNPSAISALACSKRLLSARFLTFSIRNALGCTMRTASMNRNTIAPRGSSGSILPATGHDWHGGPPMMQSTRPRNSDSVSRSKTISPSCMASAPSGRLSRHASAASRSNSFAHMHSNPALSNPTSSPPAPENRETVVSFLESLDMFDISPVDVQIFVSPIVQFPCDGHWQILTGIRGCTDIAPSSLHGGRGDIMRWDESGYRLRFTIRYSSARSMP